MMKRYNFNMIEIILAISIIAIGISSVMALFVSGIRTGNDTVMSSNLPDMSESMLSFIRTKIDDCRGKNGWDETKLAKIAPTSAVEGAGEFSSLLSESSDGAVVKGDDKGCFLYRQLAVTQVDGSGKPSKYIPTFSAIATVKRIKSSNRFAKDIILSDPQDPKAAEISKNDFKDADDGSGDAMMDKFRIVTQITLSYPADAPEAQRETKTWVMEFFNDKYDRFAVGGEDAATP